MYNIKSFKNFSILEATLDSSKEDVIYVPSRTGRIKVWDELGISEDTVFQPVKEEPAERDFVIHIRPSSFELVKWSDFKEIYEIDSTEIHSKLYVYETTSQKYAWAVAFRDIKTTMIKQKFKEGPSARGDYFRETAFIITLGRMLWRKLRLPVQISSNRGVIKMIYEQNGEAYPDPPRAEFRNQYWEFMEQPGIGQSMEKQANELIEFLGPSAARIKSIGKNSTTLAINKFLKIAIKEEREKIEQNSSNYDFLPDKITLSKWNPADMWISFEGFDWMLSDRIESVRERFSRLKIRGLSELNDFLKQSIIHKNGVIGVSLKQQIIEAGKIYAINVNKESSRFAHTYKSYSASSRNKTVNLHFLFSLNDLGNLIQKQGEGEIQVRTFDTGKTSPISMEVKGSKNSDHMSGKAGSYIKYVMGEDYEFLRKIRQETNMESLKNYIDETYEFTKPDLREIFYKDLESAKTGTSNSRLQAVFFTDWLEGLNDKNLQDNIISDIIRFAKSESNWSAPHLLVK